MEIRTKFTPVKNKPYFYYDSLNAQVCEACFDYSDHDVFNVRNANFFETYQEADIRGKIQRKAEEIFCNLNKRQYGYKPLEKGEKHTIAMLIYEINKKEFQWHLFYELIENQSLNYQPIELVNFHNLTDYVLFKNNIKVEDYVYYMRGITEDMMYK